MVIVGSEAQRRDWEPPVGIGGLQDSVTLMLERKTEDKMQASGAKNRNQQQFFSFH